MNNKSLEDEFTVVQLGKPFPFVNAPTEGAISEFFSRSLSNQLLIAASNITAIEQLFVQEGSINVGLKAEAGVIALVWEFSLDNPYIPNQKETFEQVTFYDARFYKQDDLELPDLITENTRIPIQIYLVESTNRIVKAMRYITMSPAFSRELIQAVHSQLKMSPSHADNMIINSWEGLPVESIKESVKLHKMGER